MIKNRWIFRLFLIIHALFLLTGNSNSQEFVWETGLHLFFDNREYYNDYAEPQTIFGTRPNASIGIVLYEDYSFHAGLDALYEFGTAIDDGSIKPLLYFRFKKDPVLFQIGAFHRKNLLDLPNVLQSDTVQYYRPTIEGIFLEYRKSWGYHNVWIDWTSKQTETNREMFELGASGIFKKSLFFYRHDYIMTHYALDSDPQTEEHIRDNGGLYARIGVFLPKKDVFDSLSFSTGYTMSFDRLRSVYDFDLRSGSLSELFIQYKGFGIRSSIYFGEGQTQMGGDPLYAASFYNRNDFFWRIFRKDLIEGKVEFTIHVIEDVVDFSQALTLYVNISGSRKFRSSD